MVLPDARIDLLLDILAKLRISLISKGKVAGGIAPNHLPDSHRNRHRHTLVAGLKRLPLKLQVNAVLIQNLAVEVEVRARRYRLFR